MRAVYDLAEPEQSVFIYQTGQSGHVFDSRSRSMASAWAAGHFRPLQTKSTPVHRLLLTP
jgi:penicillin amidase